MVEWHAVSHSMEERTHFCYGNAQAEALAMLHKVVMDLSHTHSWEIAIKYNIQQCELSSLNPTHDLSSLDITALMVIAACASVQQPPPPPSFSPSKCQVAFEVS